MYIVKHTWIKSHTITANEHFMTKFEIKTKAQSCCRPPAVSSHFIKKSNIMFGGQVSLLIESRSMTQSPKNNVYKFTVLIRRNFYLILEAFLFDIKMISLIR